MVVKLGLCNMVNYTLVNMFWKYGLKSMYLHKDMTFEIFQGKNGLFKTQK